MGLVLSEGREHTTHRPPPALPDIATRIATLLGQPTGWSYMFEVPSQEGASPSGEKPPVTHALWTTGDWLRWIGDRWYRVPLSFKEPLQ